METPIQILSTEMIKPSSPTPHHHKYMKLSYLDQLLVPVYIPIIFFYEAKSLASSNQSYISQSLKQSLSNILTSFYPLAGTIQHHSLVDCNDAGVEFIEAQAQTSLANAIQHHNNDNLHRYAPLYRTQETLLAVKLTSFECGGISIGICFSHKLADCTSIMAFLNAWAATCRGETGIVKSSFNLADHFSARDFPQHPKPSPLNQEVVLTKRFVFDEETLMRLKKEGTSPSVMNPTKVEVVSAFITKQVLEIVKNDNATSGKMTLPIRHVVNLRTRMKSQLHSFENVFGNCVMASTALYNTKSVDGSYIYRDLVSKFRGLSVRINEDYITEAQTGDGYVRDFHNVSSVASKRDLLDPHLFSSWCRFPIYDVNYGWGNPTWACTTALPIKNFTVLMDSKCGKGIEAWICMEKDKLEKLDTLIKPFLQNEMDIYSS